MIESLRGIGGWRRIQIIVKKERRKLRSGPEMSREKEEERPPSMVRLQTRDR